jgi:hypothetical protein
MTEVTKTEIELLKDEADELGLDYHPSIGVDKLKKKIEEFKAEDVDEPVVKSQPKQSIGEIKKKASEQVRIRVTCMNPAKKEWESELFCTGNAKIGTFKKVVPFETEWHVPRIIFNMIKNRKYQTFVTEKTKNGVSVKRGKMLNEFAVEELPPLTEAELKDLAQRQAMAAGTAE